MTLKKEKKDKVVQEYRKGERDTGSSEVQVALLSARIKELTEHFSVHKKDVHSRQGLLRLVNRRRKLLDYLKSKNTERYKTLVSRLELRG
ncbi:MAG: 30S ribosomal protein S15 [Gammaproteobacteria bacterium]|nr:30S ribosomal protein S15 [Gammaproteobacteria bacterium]